MSMQSYSGAPSRNTIKAAGPAKPGKVGLPAPHASSVTSSGNTKAAPASGSSVAGFSGTGVKSGKIK